MKRTYIATTSEAKALHDGTQTAIIVKHSNKQPYAIGQEVVVREVWMYRHKHDKYYHKADYPEFEPYAHQGWQSPATMPVSAARTRFRIVSCEAVRVRGVEGHVCNDLPIDLPCEYQQYIIHKLGQSAWDNNDYIFYYKIEKI
jgi:hypothetical protein